MKEKRTMKNEKNNHNLIENDMEIYNSEQLKTISKMLSHNQELGDKRLELWEIVSTNDENYSCGTRWIDTNADPVFDSYEGFDELEQELEMGKYKEL